MALSKDFDAKNGFLGGINIKPMGVPAKTDTPKDEPKKEEKKSAEVKEVKKAAAPEKNVTKVTEKNAEPKKQENKIKEAAVKEEPQVNKGGRPKKYDADTVRTTIFIPEDLLEEMEIAKIKYNGSRTEYIIELIKKDLKKNKDEYEALKKIFKK